MMRCFCVDCNQEGRGYPFEHKWLITPYPFDLCNSHAAELFGFLESRDALALELFARRTGLVLILRDSLAILAMKAAHGRHERTTR